MPLYWHWECGITAMAFWRVVSSGLLLPCLLDGELTDQHGAPVPNAGVRVLQQAPDHAAQRVPLTVLVLRIQAPAVSTITPCVLNCTRLAA